MAQPNYDTSGIVSRSADQTSATYLPLQSLDAHVLIADVSARVFLKQLYSHNGSDTLPEAYYVFPVPARAAVCSFEVKSRDGVELKGVVKELSQAKMEYEEARSKGWLTGLLEQFRQDVFVVSIGSMPPNTHVTVVICYVVDLSEDDQIDTVRFQLSSHVRARYGAPSNSILYYDKIHRAPLSITVEIKMPGPIFEVTSVNHPIHDVPMVSNSGPPRPGNYVCKQFISSDLVDLRKDFLLIVYAGGLGRPRCLAEHLSHEENALRGITGPTTAFACTIVPRFDINAPSTMQEYLFLVDRSGSMTGIGISMARETLKLLLKQLPSTNALFNIYSFGNDCFPLWSTSQPKTNATVLAANHHVDCMDANLGGTEILRAIYATFTTRRCDIPTCVFVLTDGGFYDIDALVATVRNVVVNAHVTAPLRVFTLGMGSGASSELCERLALAGNGSHMMTVDGEPLAFKAIRLVNAMRTPQVEEMKIDWGGLSQVRQAPHRIPTLSPGMRLLVTAIIPGSQTPTEINIRLRLLDGTTFDYRVPVQTISDIPTKETFPNQAKIPPLIHTLAAHLLIQDVEGGDRLPLNSRAWAGLTPGARRDVVKKYIVDLGTQYQIASSCTAFVAIAVPKPPSPQVPRNTSAQGSEASQQTSKRPDNSSGGSSRGTAMSHGPDTRSGGRNGSQQGSNSGSTNSNTKGSQNTSKSKTEPSVSNALPEQNSKRSDSSPGGNSRGTAMSHGPETKSGSRSGSRQGGHSGSANSNTKGSQNTSKSKTEPSNFKASNALPAATQQTPTGSKRSPTHNSASISKKTKSSSFKGSNKHPPPVTQPIPPGSKGSPTDTSVSGTSQTSASSHPMPGAYIHSSPDTGTTAAGGIFDFFTHNASPGSALTQEVLCIPDPRGGSPMVFTAPPLRQTTVFTIAKSWLNSLRSFVFSRRPAGGPRGGANATGTHSAFPVTHNPLMPKEITAIAQLQTADGGFSRLSWELASIVGIPVTELRNAMPSTLTSGGDNECLWATAIAVAFCQKTLASHVALWEDMTEAASRFGSRLCGGTSQFDAIVQEAWKLFVNP